MKASKVEQGNIYADKDSGDVYYCSANRNDNGDTIHIVSSSCELLICHADSLRPATIREQKDYYKEAYENALEELDFIQQN